MTKFEIRSSKAETNPDDVNSILDHLNLLRISKFVFRISAVAILAAGCSSPDKANITLRKQNAELRQQVETLQRQHEADVPACRVDIPDGATPQADEDCIRGEVPKHIAIESIGVDADIEIQEILDGALQDPTGPTLVTWYKETSRLGERGNGVYAGHLNYWGVTEGVFFAIKTLMMSDTVTASCSGCQQSKSVTMATVA